MEGIIKGSSLNSLFKNLLARFPSLHSCFIFDSDGVELLKVSSHPGVDESIDQQATHAEDFGIAMEQATKLNLGEGKDLISFFGKCTLVQLNFSPLIVSLVGSEELNCGALLATRPDLDRLIQPIRQKIPENIQ